MSITSSEAPRASTETLQASMILMMRHGKSTTHSHDGKTKTKFRQFIEVTLKDGSKYIINTTAEILDLQSDLMTLKERVSDVKKEISALEERAQRYAKELVVEPGYKFTKDVKNVKGQYLELKAIVEEAQKELKAKEKGLAAAQKEAKKRGKAVSPTTVKAFEDAKRHVDYFMSPEGRFIDLHNYIIKCEAELPNIKRSIDEKRDQIARMSAEKAATKTRLRDLTIEHVCANPRPKKASLDYFDM
jgi:chromosome segregation ATPase